MHAASDRVYHSRWVYDNSLNANFVISPFWEMEYENPQVPGLKFYVKDVELRLVLQFSGTGFSNDICRLLTVVDKQASATPDYQTDIYSAILTSTDAFLSKYGPRSPILAHAESRFDIIQDTILNCGQRNTTETNQSMFVFTYPINRVVSCRPDPITYVCDGDTGATRVSYNNVIENGIYHIILPASTVGTGADIAGPAADVSIYGTCSTFYSTN